MFLQPLAMDNKCPGKPNRPVPNRPIKVSADLVARRLNKASRSNHRAPAGTLSLRRQGQTRNQMGAEPMSGIIVRKRDPDIRNLQRAPLPSDTKIIPVADRITAPATTDTTGQL
jgi:hypothetical protein